MRSGTSGCFGERNLPGFRRKKEMATLGREAQELRVLYPKFWKWKIPGGGATSDTKELEEKAVLAPADQEKEPAGYARV